MLAIYLLGIKVTRLKTVTQETPSSKQNPWKNTDCNAAIWKLSRKTVVQTSSVWECLNKTLFSVHFNYNRKQAGYQLPSVQQQESLKNMNNII